MKPRVVRPMTPDEIMKARALNAMSYSQLLALGTTSHQRRRIRLLGAACDGPSPMITEQPDAQSLHAMFDTIKRKHLLLGGTVKRRVGKTDAERDARRQERRRLAREAAASTHAPVTV